MIKVTLEEAKDHLRIDHDLFDAELSLKIMAATARVEAHCQGTDFNTLTPSQESLIKAAILNLVGVMDRIRAEEERGDKDYLPPSVHMLLMPFRLLEIPY